VLRIFLNYEKKQGLESLQFRAKNATKSEKKIKKMIYKI
jgi:hypothetical protein